MAKGLGSGLGALLGDEAMNGEAGITRAPVEKIEPRADQPRSKFDQEKLEELAASIREHGVIQPVTVRALDGGFYQIIAGERRWRAARLAGLGEIPINIIECDDRTAAELALVENLQREDLNPVEEARGYRALMEGFGLTQEQVADRVGKSRPVVTNALRILKLSESVQALLEAGRISPSHARAIMELEDEREQSELAVRVAQQELSVRETAAEVKKLTAGKKPKRPGKNPRVGRDGVDYMARIEQELTQRLGRRVRVEAGAKSGVVKLDYYGDEDFEELYRLLKSIKGVGR